MNAATKPATNANGHTASDFYRARTNLAIVRTLLDDVIAGRNGQDHIAEVPAMLDSAEAVLGCIPYDMDNVRGLRMKLERARRA